MSGRNRNLAAADVPVKAGVLEPRRPQGDATPGSADLLIADPVSTARERQTIAPALASGKPTARPGGKLGIVLGLLEAPEGASLTRLVEVTGWLPHTTRAALTGLRKRGYAVMSAKAKGADERSLSIYRIAAEKVAS